MLGAPAELGGAAALDQLVQGEAVGEGAELAACLVEGDRAGGALLAGGLAGGAGDVGEGYGVAVDGVEDAAGVVLDEAAVEARQVLDVDHRQAGCGGGGVGR